MTLLVYKEGLTMIMLDHVLGRRMIDMCHAADTADRMDNTIEKGYGFGDRVNEIVHHLDSTAVVLLGPQNMVEHQARGVPTEMVEFYEIFQVNDGGPLLTLLPTTMPIGILDMAFRFEQDLDEGTLRQNTGHMIKDSGQTAVGEPPVRSVGYPDTAHDYRSITRRSRRPRRRGE